MPRGITPHILLALFVASAAVLLIVDRALKQLALDILSRHGSSEAFTIGGISFFPHRTHNILFDTVPMTEIIHGMIVLLLVGLVFLAVRVFRKRDYWSGMSLGIVLTGAFSNWYDRITYGSVIDFIAFPWNAVMNTADIYIIIGTVLLFIGAFRRRTHAQNEKTG